MKQLLFIFSFFCLSIIGKAQKAYIQVNGEAGLSVYLNNTFKGKTTAELNGYIVENVPPGKNLIKVEKDGYAPFEEYITVKAGEVFSYKVKPFSKHTVIISEQGRAGVTEKKADIKTGKLVIQSLPIEIKITIPQIEGVNNLSKTKDEWIANSVPEGSYEATFKFNNKTITKTIQVDADNTTSAFINMLSGEFTTKSTLDEKRERQKALDALSVSVKEFCSRYKFKKWQGMNEFLNDHPEAKFLLSHTDSKDKSTKLDLSLKYLKKQECLPGYTYINFERGDLHTQYTFVFTKDYKTARAAYDKALTELKNSIPSEYLSKTDTDSVSKDGVSVYDMNTKTFISLSMSLLGGEWYQINLSFLAD